MNVFVIAFNRLTMLRNLCDHIYATGHEPIIIDNSSSYQPLLDWYDNECLYKVHRMSKNYGHQVFWAAKIKELYPERFYAVTDHDLSLEGVPSDYIGFLLKGLKYNPLVVKAGLSLRIDDLPNNPYANEAKNWEQKFWLSKQDNLGFYSSPIDTTFAVYDSLREFGELPNDRFFSAVRSPAPYVAKHIPWYNTKESIEGDEEEQYYLSQTCTYWAEKFKQLL